MKVETQDFYLSAFLCMNGLPIKSMKDAGHRKLFIFDDTERYQELKQKYYWNKASVSPLEYKKEIRNLKDLIMNS